MMLSWSSTACTACRNARFAVGPCFVFITSRIQPPGLGRIIGTDGAIASPVSQAVTAFSARYPGVLFELYRASSELIVSAVKDGRADIGAGLNLQPEAEVELASRLDDQLAAVMCPAHPLAAKSSVHLCELSRYPIGTFERNSGVGRALQRL